MIVVTILLGFCMRLSRHDIGKPYFTQATAYTSGSNSCIAWSKDHVEGLVVLTRRIVDMIWKYLYL